MSPDWPGTLDPGSRALALLECAHRPARGSGGWMPPRRVAPFFCALAGTMLVVVELLVIGALGSEPVHADGVVYLLGFLVMALAGCVLVWFLPRHAIGWVFVAGGIGTLLAAALRGLAVADVPGASG